MLCKTLFSMSKYTLIKGSHLQMYLKFRGLILFFESLTVGGVGTQFCVKLQTIYKLLGDSVKSHVNKSDTLLL